MAFWKSKVIKIPCFQAIKYCSCWFTCQQQKEKVHYAIHMLAKRSWVQIKEKRTWPISLSPSLTKTASLTSSTFVFQMDNSWISNLSKFKSNIEINTPELLFIELPDWSSSSTVDSSLEKGSGAPYHFLNLGPPIQTRT